ncbi:amino acid ABC transporter permease [Aeromicrobium sp. YIM 150415]|nr:amino acid ABC transporter permease [Aeromicrobium sp. YIM 150415]
MLWLLLAVGIVATVVALGSRDFWDPERWRILLDTDLLRLLGEGAIKTIWVGIVSLAISVVLAVALGRWGMSRHRPLRAAVAIYVELFRGLPLLLLIFFLYLGLPRLGLEISTFWALTVGISLFTSANLAEILRGGIDALGRGQREAAESLGMSERDSFFRVLLPQATRMMLPSAIAQLVILVKETSLGFVIGYTELLRNGRSAVEFLGSAYAPAIYVAVALFYLAINVSLTLLARRLARRPRVKPPAAEAELTSGVDSGGVRV